MVRCRRKAKLLGLGLDGKDQEIRVTRGEVFDILGGSEDTHRSMQEKCIKFGEKLQASGKQVEDLERQEFLDLAAQCRMNVLMPRGQED
jgi:hypothetical protein